MVSEHAMSVMESGIENDRRTLVLVIGMHRSGTSTVAGALGILGATMPATGLGLSEDNPKGHFEPKEIVALHDRVLAAAGMHWWDWDKFPDVWYDSAAAQPFVDELVAIIRAEFGDAPLFVVKDPRTCKLLPLWRRAAALLNLNVAAVLPFRHPEEVARSLHARDRFPLPNTHMAWLRYVLEAERESRGMRRVFIRYEDLLVDGRLVMQRVVKTLQLRQLVQTEDSLYELDQFIEPDLRRSRAASPGIDHLHPWLRETMIVYGRGTEMTMGTVETSILDKIHEEFGKACGAFVPALDATNRGFEEAQRRNMLIPGLVAERDAAQKATRNAHEMQLAAEARELALEREADQSSKLRVELQQLRAELQLRGDKIGMLEAQIRQGQKKASRRWWQRG